MLENSSVSGLLTRYQHPNHQASCCLETDDSGNIITYEEYHPFGTTSYQAKNSTITAAAKRYRYTGMERDEESGLSYHNARYYISWLGRWMNPDPIGIGDGVNVYAYCKNDPVGNVDDSGTQLKPNNKKTSDSLFYSTQWLPNSNSKSNQQVESESDKGNDPIFGSGSGLLGLYNSTVRLNYMISALGLLNEHNTSLGFNWIGGARGRFELKLDMRNQTLGPWKNYLDHFYGAVTPSNKPAPSFWKTSAGWNSLGVIGFGLGVYSLRSTMNRIATSKDPVGQTVIESGSLAGSYWFMQKATPYALKIKNKWASAGVMVGAGLLGSYVGYQASKEGISNQEYTQRLSDKLGIKSVNIPLIQHSELDVCSYCNDKAANSWWPTYYFRFSDPTKWHPENYRFTLNEEKFGLGWDKVHPDLKK